MLAQMSTEKIIPMSFPSVQHLPGSKMIDDRDKLLGIKQVNWLTQKRRTNNDLVIITEKVDGMNGGVLRKDGYLYPLIRKGYDCRANPYNWINNFANFVQQNEQRLMSLLKDGERICGEWMIKTHTLSYKLPHEPFIAFDIICGSDRVPYFNFRERAVNAGFVTAGLVHAGEAMSPGMALGLLGSGYHGVIGDPEGLVYRYEDSQRRFMCSGKFVSNPQLGNEELFKANESLFNKWKKYNHGGM